MNIAADQKCCCSSSTSCRAPVLPIRRGRASLARRKADAPRQSRQRLVAQAFYGAAAPALSGGMGLTLSSGLVSLFSFAVGGLGLAYWLADQLREEGPNPECTTCEGTGRVACVCNRWSDGDKGCSICGGSGRMACPSCGGGGTAVPIASRLTIQRDRNLMDSQRQ